MGCVNEGRDGVADGRGSGDGSCVDLTPAAHGFRNLFHVFEVA